MEDLVNKLIFLKNIIENKQYEIASPEEKNDVVRLKHDVTFFLQKYCDHTWEYDDIDISPDESTRICYCNKCYCHGP